MKQECARCDKPSNIPMYCQECWDVIIEYTEKRAKKEVFDDIEKLWKKCKNDI